MISSQGVSLIFQAAYFIVIGRTLGSSEYGAFVGVVALVNVLSQFSSLGMEMILVRNISRKRESFAATWGSALQISLYGFVLLFILAMLIGHFTLKPELQRLIPYVALSDALFGKLGQIASRAFQGAGMMAQTARLAALSNITRAVFALVLFVFAMFKHFHVDALLWTRIYWLSSLATAIVAFRSVTKILGWPAFARIRLHDLTDGFSFSLSSSSISIYNDIDKTFLASAGQLYAAGIYSAAYRVIDVASVPIYAIYSAATPRFFRKGQQSVEEASAFAAKLLLPLIRGLHYAWGTTITGSSSQWYRTVLQLGAALGNLLLNVALITHWSWWGAAVASLLTDAGLAVASWVVVQRLRARKDVRAMTQVA